MTTRFGAAIFLTLTLIAPPIVHLATAQDVIAPAESQPLDIDRLPVSFERIKQQLETRRPRTSESFSQLRLNVRVEVYGRAPRMTFFETGFDPLIGPVPYGGPTHHEMLEIVTPREFRPGAISLMSLDALLKWLTK